MSIRSIDRLAQAARGCAARFSLLYGPSAARWRISLHVAGPAPEARRAQDHPTQPMKRVLVALALIAVAAAAAIAYGWHAYRAAPLSMESSPLRVRIERGMSVAAIAEAMQRAGIEVPAWRLRLAARLRGDARSIKAGVYEFASPVTLAGVLDKMVRGEVVLADLTVVEGWTFAQMRASIAAHPELLHDSVAMGDVEILRRIGAEETQPEGLFFPSTYRFSPGSSDLDVYRQSYRLLKATLEEAWNARQPGLPLADPYQALVMASIIEKETGQEADRAKVSAVFVNRLRVGMPLQSDPTTIYGIGERFDGNLRKRDLLADTPYNTYTRRGLPPTPIALPGRASILAAVQPASIRALYFVARGDGSSEFSDDLAAHNRAVARYQLGR